MPTAADPLSAKALRQRAPQEFRTALEESHRQYAEAKALGLATFRVWRDRINELAKFDRHIGIGSQLTEAGVEKRRELLRAVEEAEKDLRAAEECEMQARPAQLRADREFQAWVNAERDRLRRAATPEPPAEPQRLAEQREKLSAKIG